MSAPAPSSASRLARWHKLLLHPSERRFMALVGAVVGVWLLAVLAFNALVDPLALTPWDVRVAGFNAAKTEQIGWDPLFKYYQLIYRAPDLVLLGSSRIEQGVDPEDSRLAGARSPYNLGVIGANMEMIDAYWRHALRWSEGLQTVVVGLDFFAFNANRPVWRSFDRELLKRDHFPLDEFGAMLISRKLTRHSGATVRDNFSGRVARVFAFDRRGVVRLRPTDGKSAIGDPLTDGDPDAAGRRRFAATLREFVSNPGLYGCFALSEDAFVRLEALVGASRRRGVRVVLFTSPSHASLNETLDALGLWPAWEAWKRRLAEIAPYWDFATYNSVTMEPATGDRRYYHEPAHYTFDVGRLMLARFFESGEESGAPDFGALVTSDNVDGHLEAVRRDRAEWLARRPGFAADVKAWLAGVQPCSPPVRRRP